MTEKKVLKASQVLALANSNETSSQRSIKVTRPLDQENDLGNLLGSEINEFTLNPNELETDLKSLARDNCQLIINDIFNLPTERVEEVIVATLPPPTESVPREKTIPKAKPLTKWEQYAKEKGIQKEKKSKLVWDDVVKEWVPRFGYKKAKAEVEKNWLLPYKEGQDQDPFEKAIEEKRERVAKNELQRLRNIARAKKGVNVPAVGLAPMNPKESQSSDDLKKASQLATTSTASLGKFQDKLPKKLQKQVKEPKGKKRQFDPMVFDGEKDKNLRIFEQISNKKAKLDVTKAVGQQINAEERSASAQKFQKGKGGKKGKGGGGKKGGKGKGKGGGGKKSGGKKSGGKK